MSDPVEQDQPGEEENGGEEQPVVRGLRRTRTVLWVAVAVFVPVALLVAVLATRPPAATRAVKSPLVGKPAPAIDAESIDGSGVRLADLRGKWVVVNFFATWCVPCVQEHPDLVNFSAAHQVQGDAAVLGVVYSDSAQAVRSFRDEKGGTWPMVTDPKGRIALDYGVAGVPESFLVDPNGVVAAKLLGGVRATDLEELLAKAKAGRPQS